ncbi:MAG: gliding motility lipoprotein GldD [Bacteroidales bacterium]|nr:gliding motility lipoprotein GldD [Bacteroidales bacterium]
MMIQNNISKLFTATIFIVILLIAGCRDRYTPKPRGYYRIDFPQKKYKQFKSDCPYSFEYPEYSVVKKDESTNTEPCWINIDFPRYNGSIHISYKNVTGNLNAVLEDAHTLAYKHTVKADAINEHLINKSNDRVFGILYDIEGNAASSVQFYLTDSTDHFLRGALYFKTRVEKDSLAPVIDFFRQDIIHFIDTFEWN